VERLKRNLEAKSPKTVNNILAVLSVLLKRAAEWEVIERMPGRRGPNERPARQG
jgi:hypothetical protein